MKLGIVQKLLVGILLPLVLVLGLIGVLLGVQVSGTVKQMMTQTLTSQTETAAEEVDAFLSQYFGAVDGLLQSNVVLNVATDPNKVILDDAAEFSRLLSELRSMQQTYQDNVLNVWYMDVTANELVLQDNSRLLGSEVDFTQREWYIQCAAQKKTILTSAYEDGRTHEMVVTVAGPVMSNGQMLGVIGIDVSLEELSSTLNAISIGEGGYVVLIDSANLILASPDASLVGSDATQVGCSQNMMDVLLNNQTVEGLPYTQNGSSYYGSTVYLSDFGYELLGVLHASEYDGHVASTVRVVVIGFVLCALILAAIVTLLAVSIIRPLKKLSNVAEHLADGELDVDYQAKGNDEVAALGVSISRIVERLKTYIQYIGELSAVLNQMGQGDLVFQLKYDYQGEFAKLKDALLDIQRNMSNTLSSVSQAAVQVNMGADQIATGAQALAQGATEQASAVQDLSNTVRELEEKVTNGAQQANTMITRLEQVKDEVDASNGQMQEMLVAMGDISRHSSDIGKIIKTIDDIAFQTNILALNAAVEAARAGEAGKGFAVVADEVRSLAGKSAAAAQETNELIERSVTAVKRGEGIAHSTADVLASAASKSTEVVEAIEQVTRDYQEQADHLRDIATGVDQISTVVQTNSATAEESAAASQELAGQASYMQGEINRFHLQNTDAERRPVPAKEPMPDDMPSVSSSAQFGSEKY
ncbi:methyl-accepting chemotaxis protein [Candidatus Avoscillospira sp. LCP25S3_F1]|uniref:methyl-accepting chemotaxis protein n=1 Tax=Candidatus Avoscillospira sp. LCP25S3_F1 TaxID=3438825 RepID=UPI003F8FCB9E